MKKILLFILALVFFTGCFGLQPTSQKLDELDGIIERTANSNGILTKAGYNKFWQGFAGKSKVKIYRGSSTGYNDKTDFGGKILAANTAIQKATIAALQSAKLSRENDKLVYTDEFNSYAKDIYNLFPRFNVVVDNGDRKGYKEMIQFYTQEIKAYLDKGSMDIIANNYGKFSPEKVTEYNIDEKIDQQKRAIHRLEVLFTPNYDWGDKEFIR